ncbi:MAG: nucleotide exchange factor GrpE [Parcubacteria group bacterium 21-54-25]|nr:MAG: nucleotide exchange factor GrpE [Parcubacteria group bacterium 21-54-25]HQU07810.1 nucleotide exchange factor GrpE [Candidatus Paceibacterota bacterium]
MKGHAHEENDDVVIESDASAGAGDDIDLIEEEAHAEGKLAKVKKELAQCRTERQEYLDGWQRAKADYVNALKRFEEEKAALKSRSTAEVVGALLPVLDSLERAKVAGELPQGFGAIAKQLAGAFAALGVSEISTEPGDVFDPMRHEAMGQDETDDAELDDTVSAVLEKGWQVGDAVLRPVKVRVARHA